jgi:hypothetical protein
MNRISAFLGSSVIVAWLIASGKIAMWDNFILGILLLLIAWLAPPFGKPIRKAIEEWLYGPVEDQTLRDLNLETPTPTPREAILRIKHTDEAANRRYMRFEGNRGPCTWYLEIVNEFPDIDAQDVEIKVESYDQIVNLVSPRDRTGAFTLVGIVLAFERGGNTRTIRKQDSEWVKFLSFDRQIPRRWIQIGEYGQSPYDMHDKIVSVYTPHRIEVRVRAINANPVTASFLVKAESEMLQVQRL